MESHQSFYSISFFIVEFKMFIQTFMDEEVVPLSGILKGFL